MELVKIKIKPRIAPQDFLDVVIGLFIVLPILCAVVLFFPVILIAWITDSTEASTLTLLLVSMILLCNITWSLELSPDGIRFVRLLGKPKFLRWDDITEIAEASRKEVVLYGWLLPFFPPRETTMAHSALGHFRIRWNGGYTYFPPANADEFKKLVDDFRSKKNEVKSSAVL